MAAAMNADRLIDTSKEVAYRLADVGEHLPNKPGYRTVVEWVSKGMITADRDGRVKLQSVRIAGVLHTTVEAYHRMVRRVNLNDADE